MSLLSKGWAFVESLVCNILGLFGLCKHKKEEEKKKTAPKSKAKGKGKSKK